MITFKELIKDLDPTDICIDHEHNLEELLRRINIVRTRLAKPMIVTSGYRTMYDHKRIYSIINAKRVAKGLPEISIPMGSAHLKGCAVDISDPDGSLYTWCQANVALLEEIGLWCEEKDNEARVHFQTYAPKSGKRFFKP